MEKIERAQREHQARIEAERAAFTGSCFPCRDDGPCPHCGRGLAVIADQQRQVRAARYQALIAGLHLSRRQQPFTLDSYALLPGHDGRALAAVRSFLDRWDGERGLLLLGPYGTGKTGLLIGLLKAIAACSAAREGADPALRLWSSVALFADLRAGFATGTYEGTVKAARTATLLALDDLGAEKPSDWVQEQVYAIVNHRYEAQLPTIATSNLGLEELAARIGERSVWRLYETVDVIEVRGANLRSG